MTGMPKRTTQHVSRDRAVLLAESCLPANWIVRKEAQDNDYGIDLEVELADSEVTGRLFKAQVKGHQSIPWTTQGSYLQPIREETLQYWRALPVPVVLLIVDLCAGATFWASGKVPSGAAGVRVMRDSVLPEDAQRLASDVIDWIDERSAKALLYGLPFFSDIWENINQFTGLDCFMPVEPGEYALLQYVYRQIRLVREAVGLATTMLPWEIWLARAQAVFGTSHDLYWGIYDEVVEYLLPFVEEALAAGKKQLDAEMPTADNVTAKYWASGYRVHYRAGTNFDAAGAEFWRRVDDYLRRLGVLKFEAARGAKFPEGHKRNELE